VNINELSDIWHLPLPWDIEPIAGSSHNHLALITSADQQRHVLCTYAHEQPALIEFSYAVVHALAKHGVSFALPVPKSTKTGQDWHLYDDGYRAWLMTMTPWYAGDHPAVDDVAAAARAGAVLAELIQACQSIQVTVAPPPAYGLFHRIHPYIIDPMASLRGAPIAGDGAIRIVQMLSDLQQMVPELYEQLPTQIIHGDFTHRNLIVRDDAVCAVLDFEASRVDLRIVEIAIAFLEWGSFDGNHDHQAIQALLQTLLPVLTLSDAEMAALPTAMRLVRMVRLMLAIGRYQQGIERSVMVERATQALLHLDDWLLVHGERFVAELSEIHA
jgi:Ser/Thr protein kinase RdoA (MazF antagonist)